MLESRPLVRLLFLLSLVLSVAACSSFMNNASNRLADSVRDGMLNNNDPEMVAAALPAYLLMLDGMLHGDNKDASLVRAASQLNSAYAGLFVEDEAQAMLLTQKSLDYAQQAACLDFAGLCNLNDLPFEIFHKQLQQADASQVEALYALGVAWSGWLQARSGDWNAIAKLSQAKALLKRVNQLDPGYQQAGAALYLGVMEALVPPAMGGKPDVAREYFEQALRLADPSNLTVPVYYARYYARLMFDQHLHDRLLKAVISADPRAEGLTLMNTIAQREATQLLAQSPEYF